MLCLRPLRCASRDGEAREGGGCSVVRALHVSEQFFSLRYLSRALIKWNHGEC